MKRLLIYTGLGNTLTAVLVSAAVYFFSPVHPLGQFRLLLGVVTLAWLIAGIRSLKYKVQAGDLKVTHGLLLAQVLVWLRRPPSGWLYGCWGP